MKHYGLLGGLLMLLIQVAASQNPPNDGSKKPNITGNLNLDTAKLLSDEVPRWFVGADNRPYRHQGSHSDHSHDASSHSSSDRSNPSRGNSQRTSEESDGDRSASSRRPNRVTTARPTRESEDSHSDSSRSNRKPHGERSSELFHWNKHRSSSSSSEESGKKTKRPINERNTSERNSRESSSSSSEDKSLSIEWIKKPQRISKISASGSWSWEKSRGSSRRSCVRQRRSKWHRFLKLFGRRPIEASRKPMTRCWDNRKKRCTCTHNPYRSLNGTCNNLKFQNSGVIKTPLRRLVAARYCNGKSSERRSATDGRPLPSSRVITTRVFGTKRIEDKKLTQLTAIFWIFVAEDIFLGKQREKAEGKNTPRCCSPDGKMIPKSDLPDSCMAIEIPKNDPFFSTFHRQCLNYERVEIADKCKKERRRHGLRRLRLGRRRHRSIEQLNMKTSYLDLSPIYGTSKEESNKLRTLVNGQLKTRLVQNDPTQPQHPFLPIVDDPKKVCKAKREDDICYLSANSQVNKIIALAALQTLIVRYHNNVAQRLSVLHPSWNDEDLFQEARRVMIGIYQNIVYNEWLSTLLGKRTLKRLKLSLRKLRHKSHRYYVDAGAISAMASAGLTMSDTLLASVMSLVNENREPKKKINLIRTINEPYLLEKHDNFDSIIRGLTTQPAEAFDENFAKEFLNLEVTNRHGKGSGVDLVALDIQSGRDFGIITYNDARELCGLKRAKKFEDFDDTLSVKNLRHVYSCTNDVDLLVGLFLEDSYDNGVLGRVGSCLFGEQFARLLQGDRFFVTADGYTNSFTKDELNSILAVKFSTLLCIGSDSVERMQLRPFHQISSKNELKQCTEIPNLDLTPWVTRVLPNEKC